MTTEEKLTSILERVTRIEEQNKTIFNALKDANRILNGNGQPGLVARVTTLEEKHNGASRVVSVLGWLATFLLALYGAAKHHGGTP